MSLLSRVFNYVPKAERQGINLEGENFWVLDPVEDPGLVLEHLPLLLPTGSTLYLEGTYSSAVREYLEDRRAAQPTKVAVSTYWPRPDIHHMECTASNLHGLIHVIGEESAPVPCDHLHAYHGEQLIFGWWDAINRDPVRISETVEEDVVRRYSAAIGAGYCRVSEVS